MIESYPIAFSPFVCHNFIFCGTFWSRQNILTCNLNESGFIDTLSFKSKHLYLLYNNFWCLWFFYVLTFTTWARLFSSVKNYLLIHSILRVSLLTFNLRYFIFSIIHLILIPQQDCEAFIIILFINIHLTIAFILI